MLMKGTRKLCHFPVLLFYLFFTNLAAYAYADNRGDTILQGQQPMRDWEFLTSAKEEFRLQFFSPDNSNGRYLGILYNEFNDVPIYAKTVWIANRNTPIPDASGSLIIDTDGKLKITYAGGIIRSVFDNSPRASMNTTAELQDNGNFVLTELNPDGSVNRTLWQSFDYPTDTFLPGMKIGIDFRTGHKWSLTSWISKEAPALGSFTFGGDPNGTSQLMVWWQGNLYWTSGLWRDGHFDFASRLSYDNSAIFSYIANENEKYLTYSVNGSNNPRLRFRLDIYGMIKKGDTGAPAGPYGNCSSLGDLDAGCENRKYPECWKYDEYFYERSTGFIFGDSYTFDRNYNISLFDCEDKCMQNCSCVAYASITPNGTGCEIWGKVSSFTPSRHGREVYFLRTGIARTRKKWWIWFVASLGGTLLLAFSILWYFCHRKLRVKAEAQRLQNELEDTTTPQGVYSKPSDKLDKKMKRVYFYTFDSIALATNNFSSANMLGEGGFGPVYKGTLLVGQEIAIKRLSRSSGQGLTEFKNEIILIAKLQHTNLVRLLGCCIEGKEKILIYEYMPNRSLDFFLFDSSKSELLNWTCRMNIIEGVVQGLLYLHKYSRLKVIHRDLKASNILLDHDFNPKISDFGMAKIFGVHESEANTSRIVGTYGYMSPEYAIKGTVSMKTDVFSFGVLLLEIVSGKKNYSCYHLERPLNLIGYAWELWVEGRVLELMDSTLKNPSHKDEIMRCINVGLLCVQDHPEDRPSMTDVVYMLTKDAVKLPAPKEPAFFIKSGTRSARREIILEENCTNELSFSVMEAR